VKSARAGGAESADTCELILELESDTEPEMAVERAVAALVAAGAGVRHVGPLRASLEEVFAELTQADPDTEAQGA
jgi:hypothetical protein